MISSETHIGIFFLYSFMIYLILSILCKEPLQKILAIFLPLFYFGITLSDIRFLNYSNNFYVLKDVIFFLIFLGFVKVRYDHDKLPKLTYKNSSKPIFLALLFFISYILGIKAIDFHMGWYWGYILSTVSFLIGVYLYRKQIFVHK